MEKIVVGICNDCVVAVEINKSTMSNICPFCGRSLVIEEADIPADVKVHIKAAS